MLRIRRVKIEIVTVKGVYGCDIPFYKGFNFIASTENTCGKSSILAAIYYCLGFEEIIGGKGSKVLTSAFKSTIEDEKGTSLIVKNSYFYLEIDNGADCVTLLRTAGSMHRDDNLITVYYGKMDDLKSTVTLVKDMYVHLPNAAMNESGFHKFLEDFLNLELPYVATSDKSKRKLYLQLIFSCMFIEQKHGWSGLFSGMPLLGIKDAKKHIIEFILNLDTIENEKLEEQIKAKEAEIREVWKELYKEFWFELKYAYCSVADFPESPKVLSTIDISKIRITTSGRMINDVIEGLKLELKNINNLRPKAVDNMRLLKEELQATENNILEKEAYLESLKKELQMEKGSIANLKDNIKIITLDLTNNKDAAKLRDLGSNLKFSYTQNKCPICHQDIVDSLLPISTDKKIMDIDDNIKHLRAQKEMLEFALRSREAYQYELESAIKDCEEKLYILRRLYQSLKNDIYAIDGEYSETIVYKKIKLEERIHVLEDIEAKYNDVIERLKDLSNEWQQCIDKKKKLPKDKLTSKDKEKLSLLRKLLVENLKSYGYRSITDFRGISISKVNYLPLFEGFDMKYDSSASDGIRLIWAFTMALLQVSVSKNGNHPGIIIFDEPDQQSTIINDMKAFFDSILEVGNKGQVIMGITLKDSDTIKLIESLDEDKYHRYDIGNKAFVFMR